MINKLAITTLLIAIFGSQLAYAITDEELMMQDCELGVADNVVVGSIEYQQAVDDCMNEQNSTPSAEQDQGYSTGGNE